MKIWTLIIFLILILLLLFLPSCATTEYERIKIYKYDNSRGNFVRDQDKDVLDGKQAHGYFCVSPGDIEKVGSGVATCFQDLKECQSRESTREMEFPVPLPEIFK